VKPEFVESAPVAAERSVVQVARFAAWRFRMTLILTVRCPFRNGYANRFKNFNYIQQRKSVGITNPLHFAAGV
jgi:hypothetical protein